MKILRFLILLLIFSSCSKQIPECEENSTSYYHAKGKVKGENITIRKVFNEIKESETNISPKDGLITLRLHIGKQNTICKKEIFQIDGNYQPTSFNNNKLVKKIKTASDNLKGWERQLDYKMFYLIRFKIKDGKIEEIF